MSLFSLSVAAALLLSQCARHSLSHSVHCCQVVVTFLKPLAVKLLSQSVICRMAPTAAIVAVAADSKEARANHIASCLGLPAHAFKQLAIQDKPSTPVRASTTASEATPVRASKMRHRQRPVRFRLLQIRVHGEGNWLNNRRR